MKVVPSQIDGGQKGFSLVELMIAMVLGLVLLGGVIAAFVSATGSLAVNREIDRSQESMRFVFDLLADEIRQAVRTGDSPGPYLTPIAVSPDSPNVSQEITIRYPVVRTGEAVHCNGTPVTGGTILEKRFSVVNGALRCQSGPVGVTFVPVATEDLAFGLRRIRIEEWIESPAPVPPSGFRLNTRNSMSALANNNGLGVVGVRVLVEHDHVRGGSQTFVVTVALRNSILQWFKRPL
jgi:prepilin-type N-terminal cleavage/methylation domain-containing protein